MNFLIKSVAYWFIVVLIMTAMGQSFHSSEKMKTNALKQFENKIEPAQNIQKLVDKQTTMQNVEIAMWIVFVSLYGSMIVTYVKSNEKKKD